MPRISLLLLFLLAPSYHILAEENIGWRGDGTGLFPNSDPPHTWGRVSKAMQGLRYQASKPANADAAGIAMPDGVVREWLILGPVPIPDVAKAHEQDTLPNELQLLPDEGEKVENLAWKKVALDSALLNFAALFGSNPNSFAYAHTNIFSVSGGDFLLQYTHRNSTRVVLNGKQVYVGQTYGSRINLKLQKGWNHLLLKVGWDQTVTGKEGQWWAIPILLAHTSNGYDETNIAWKTPLPSAKVYQGISVGIGGPIVVGDKIFLLNEPHDFYCLNKSDGKILWIKSNSYFDALTDAERGSNPAFKEIEPLAAKWNELNADLSAGRVSKTAAEDREKVEKEMYDALKKIDGKRFNRVTSQDVGYAGLTPASDGKLVYAWFAHGVTACYDIDGNRKWIRIDNHETVEHGYTSSPVLSGGKLIVFMRDLMAFDAQTGAEAWRLPLVKQGGMNPGGFFHGTPVAAKIGDVDAVVLPSGAIHRASDGTVLFSDKRINAPQTVAAPVVHDGLVTIATTMADKLFIFPLPTSETQPAAPPDFKQLKIPTSQLPHFYLSWHTASPLVHDGLIYLMSNSGVLTVVDQKEGAIVYQRTLDLDHFESPNEGAVRGLGVSPVLGGKHIYFFGNSGAAIVIEPGREFKQVAKNKIEGLAVPGTWGERQDRVVANPFVDGKRIYYRTETGIYALEKK